MISKLVGTTAKSWLLITQLIEDANEQEQLTERFNLSG